MGKCATIGCKAESAGTTHWGPLDDRATERTCRECGCGYERRPALRAVYVADSMVGHANG